MSDYDSRIRTIIKGILVEEIEDEELQTVSIWFYGRATDRIMELIKRHGYEKTKI